MKDVLLSLMNWCKLGWGCSHIHYHTVKNYNLKAMNSCAVIMYLQNDLNVLASEIKQKSTYFNLPSLL